MKLTLDTNEQIFFYEQDYYVLSNFSAFKISWKGRVFATSEEVYHWEKFNHPIGEHAQRLIENAWSAHDAFKMAQEFKDLRRSDWDDVKIGVMRSILEAKLSQHGYVRRKLLDTGTKELVENSWRDSFWGWGPNRDGLNWLGRIWMEIREKLTI